MKRRICIALHLSVKGGSATGVLITDTCRAVIGGNVRLNSGNSESFCYLSLS
jgi:hypothetical protein